MDTTEKDRLITRLVQDYQDRLFRVCFLILRGRADAEDAVQETYIRAYNSLDTFRGDSDALTWLTRIAINCCRDIQRSGWFTRIKPAPDLIELEAVSDDCSQRDIIITMSVMNLPTKLREVVVLYYYQGYSTLELSRIIGISQPAVTNRLKRARQLLYEALREE